VAVSLKLVGQKKLIEIEYCNMEVLINGDASEWRHTQKQVFAMPGNPRYANHCELMTGWDEQNLYVCFHIHDHFLVGLEKADSLKRLHFNDGIEIYIDSHNDSRDTLDLNDYQFLVDLMGSNVIFRGDRLNLKLKHSVPKDSEIANIVFQVAAARQGTANDNSDLDSGYVVECAIPWASIGIKPKAGEQFAMDFCVNDNDTLIDFHSLPEGPVREYSNFSITGTADFGFPDQWLKVTLTGHPSVIKRFTRKYSSEWLNFLIVSLVMMLFLIGIFWYRIYQLKHIPVKTDGSLAPFIDFVINRPATLPDEKENRDLFTKARSIVLQHLDQQIRPEMLAQELAVSIRQLQRIFHDELNTTPTTFIILIKLEAAAQLLKQKNLTVAEVAYSVGFNDPAYFSRVFRKYFNCSPSNVV
jgi:AraC-like DNA-binding protein